MIDRKTTLVSIDEGHELLMAPMLHAAMHDLACEHLEGGNKEPDDIGELLEEANAHPFLTAGVGAVVIGNKAPDQEFNLGR